MDVLGPIVQIILFFWNPVSQQIHYLKDIGDNVAKLIKETEELRCKRDEIQGNVNCALSVGKTRVQLVENWLVDVRNFVTEVDSVKLEFDQAQTCLNGCCTDHFSRYRLGKRVVKMIKDVEELKEEGDFDKVAESPRRPTVKEMQVPAQLAQQSTSEQTLEKIWQCLHDEDKGIICVYGMGGVGKTTLMQALNNRFVGTNGFNVVIWATVSKDLNLGVIQEKIGEQLSMTFGDNEGTEIRRDRLFARLKNVRYMLILDDMWQAFSLDQVGIPKPDKQNRCKIAITTRSLEVSKEMEADKFIKVKTLTIEEAWDLFSYHTGDVVLSLEIAPIAKNVVRECGGLPLAIKTVGRAMRGWNKKELWDDALRALRGSAPEVPGMDRQVFLPLKYSYDSLRDPKLQLCFLYCSLYPEDYEISVKKLVRYWAMEEGFMDNVSNLEEAKNKGHAILERLKDACLLEEANGGSKTHVKMHDLIRDLAIWITSSSSSSSSAAPKFLVKAGEGLVQPPEEKKWEGMRRISLTGNKITSLQIMPNCPDLVSLFLDQNFRLRTINANFFQLMHGLQILNLSRTNIISLPKSLSSLVNLHVLILRGCDSLVEMPTLGQLKQLQLLDLSSTGLEELPEGLENLVKLNRLDLSDMYKLDKIPCNTISMMTSLEDLRLLALKCMNVTIWREVATLTRLTCLKITLPSLDGFTRHEMEHPLWSDLRRFSVHIGLTNEYLVRGGDKLIIFYCCDNFPGGIEGLTRETYYLELWKCNSPACLSQLVGNLKSLRGFAVDDCKGVKCIIDWIEVGDDALNYLTSFFLIDLPNLEMVFVGEPPPLPLKHFQQLDSIHVENCPKLKFLFSSSMVDHLHQLEWLEVFDCAEMEEIVQGDVLSGDVLPRLRRLNLHVLPKLSSICSKRHIFTSLEEIVVNQCLELKKLPLLCSSTQKLGGYIEGERKWWEGLEWDDDHSKSLYSTIYTEH